MLDRDAIIDILREERGSEIDSLFRKAYQKKVETIGSKVYLRGLIEISNSCTKNCYYCGIRRGNREVNRYELVEKEVLDAAEFALNAGYGSLVIQGGERSGFAFTRKITKLLKEIKTISDNKLGITLSLGEQSYEVYKEWFEAGAHRYLLRIETSNEDLYYKIHPKNTLHSFQKRVEALSDLRKAGYQVGTGVMIGLPFQQYGDLADDLIFFRDNDIDMIGMGPYIEHTQTPLIKHQDLLKTPQERLLLTFKMISILRLLVPDINIAATTAMQTIDPLGREKAVMAGANIIMPNMTINRVRKDYQIYENKPGIDEDADITKSRLVDNLKKANISIGWNEWGDSRHFDKNRK